MNYLKYSKTIIESIADTLNFLNKLSWSKVLNILKVRTSYRIAGICKRPVVWGKPYAYSIEPTSLCNLLCPECPTGKREILRDKNHFDPALYESILEQIADHACYLMLYLQGEPFLSKSIFELMQKASLHNIYTCISTNGHFMSEDNAYKTVNSGLDRIIISLDGTTPEVYRQYRKRGNFQEVIAGIRRLVAAKKQLHSHKPYIILQFIVFRHNQHQVGDVKALGNRMGVNRVSIKRAQLYDYTNGHPMLTDILSLARYHKKGDHVVPKNKIPNRCQRIWSTGVITTDGNMTSCCYDKHSDYVMGSAQKEKIAALWASDAFMQHRKNVLLQRGKIDMCTNCGEK